MGQRKKGKLNAISRVGSHRGRKEGEGGTGRGGEWVLAWVVVMK